MDAVIIYIIIGIMVGALMAVRPGQTVSNEHAVYKASPEYRAGEAVILGAMWPVVVFIAIPLGLGWIIKTGYLGLIKEIEDE